MVKKGRRIKRDTEETQLTNTDYLVRVIRNCSIELIRINMAETNNKIILILFESGQEHTHHSIKTRKYKKGHK